MWLGFTFHRVQCILLVSYQLKLHNPPSIGTQFTAWDTLLIQILKYCPISNALVGGQSVSKYSKWKCWDGRLLPIPLADLILAKQDSCSPYYPTCVDHWIEGRLHKTPWDVIPACAEAALQWLMLKYCITVGSFFNLPSQTTTAI